MDLATADHAQDGAGGAIQKVLEADRLGSERVAECHRLAEEKLRNARARADAILQRTDKRIALVQSRYLELIEERIARLEGSSLEASRTPSVDEEPVRAAAERLAAALTS